MRIALLGATGYIGRSLLAEATARGLDITPVVRDVQKAAQVFQQYGITASVSSQTYKTFGEASYDIVINAAGVGSPSALQQEPQRVFDVTEYTDAVLLQYLAQHPQTRAFNMSSGAVYGLNSGKPVTDGTRATYDPAALTPGDYYALAKFSSEAKHRAASAYAITDLRVFAFFSRFVDTEDTFFMSQVVHSLQRHEVFHTTPEDMARDYCSAQDLLDLILFLAARKPANVACDVQSSAPVTKFELLDHLQETFGLEYAVSADFHADSATGNKHEYYSKTSTLKALGYTPARSSLENIDHEIKALLGR